eukprot:5293755-Pyramimonas_sp.AAC.1
MLGREDFDELVLTARRQEWGQLMGSWPLFVTLNESTRKQTLQHMQFLKFNRGEAIVRQGDHADPGRFYIIKEGEETIMSGPL